VNTMDGSIKKRTGKLRIAAASLLLAIGVAVLAGCAKEPMEGERPSSAQTVEPPATSSPPIKQAGYEVDEQPGTVYYEIFVRSFYDSDGDGTGDLKGVTAKLDYLKELGIGGIWLMPIQASPSYHGYDTTDYYAINPDYGKMDDLKELLSEAHDRGIKIIMDLVVNHTSAEHPWFIDAIDNPDSPYRSWYHIVNGDEKVLMDGAAGSGSPPWHARGDSKYLGIFWGGMPDLNFDEPAVREEMIRIGQFWLEQGLDGFRLDAAKHIYGDFTSTIYTPEVTAANQAWWQQFRDGLSEVKPDAYLVGEVWDSVSVIAPFLDRALSSAFHFDLSDRIMAAAKNERDSDFAFSLGRSHKLFEQASSGAYIDAPFLSNHDDNRVMTVLDGHVPHAKMAAAILLTMPGNPFIYYGEEIGMKGAKPDEYIREPMIWYSDSNGGEGQTTWESSRHNAEAGAVSVEAQLRDENSLLEHYRKLIKWRNEEPALRDGVIAEYALAESNSKVSLYIRATAEERVLVVHNLSSEPQVLELAESPIYGRFGELLYTTADGANLENSELNMPPFSTVIVK